MSHTMERQNQLYPAAEVHTNFLNPNFKVNTRWESDFCQQKYIKAILKKL